jgi:septum formation protein
MDARNKHRLILASASPRRLELLAQIGVVPDDVHPADIDESVKAKELPQQLAGRLARAKASFVAAKFSDDIVIGADTIVACGRRILPKPRDADEARLFLKLLSGRRHRVYGGVSIVSKGGSEHSRLVMTAVVFKRLHEREIEAYLESEEWRDKAGGYAIQGKAGAFVRKIIGSYSNVVGLPLFEVSALLHAAGYYAD